MMAYECTRCDSFGTSGDPESQRCECDDVEDGLRSQLAECQRERDEAVEQRDRSSKETVRRILATRHLCEAVDRFKHYGTDNAEQDMYEARAKLAGCSDPVADIERSTAAQIAAWLDDVDPVLAGAIRQGAWRGGAK